MKKFSYILFTSIFYVCVLNHAALAQSGISLGYGESEEDMEVYRIGYQYAWDARWFETAAGYLSGYHELSVTYWHWVEDGLDEYKSDGATGGFYSPVVKYFIGDGEGMTPYAELGFGVGLISDTHIGTRRMGSAFQFEDRFGIGVAYGDHDIVFRYLHYSNAGFQSPNAGMDIFLGAYSLRF